jgi:integrase
MAARGVALEYSGDKRWASLRCTLPPKPGSGRARPYSQRISLGVSAATPDGKRRIKALKAKLEQQIFSGTFDWAAWGQAPQTKGDQTISQLISGLGRHKEATNPVSPRTWRTAYDLPLRRLLAPLDRHLTAEILLEAAGVSSSATSVRKRDITALRALAQFAELDVDLTAYRHRYSRKHVRFRDLPSDAEIKSFIDGLDRPDLHWACGILASYGLRPSELAGLDLIDFPRIRVHPDRKTGERAVLPLPEDWATNWALAERPVTPWNMESPQLIAHNLRHHMRERGWRWQIYDLRHCWARRCAERGIQPAVAARLLGHTVKEHTETYHQFIGEEHWLEMFSNQAGS